MDEKQLVRIIKCLLSLLLDNVPKLKTSVVVRMAYEAIEYQKNKI